MKRTALTLGTIAVVSWLASWAGATMLGHALAPPEAPRSPLAAQATGSQPPPEVPAPRPKRPREFYLDPILERSIFDSSKVGETVEAVEEGAPVASDLDVVLLATVVADPPKYSSALIGHETTKRVRRKRGRRRRTVRVRSVEDAAGYGVGDTLLGEATIADIQDGRVTLRRDNGRVEYLALWTDDDEEDPESSGSSEEEDAAVEKVAKNHYTVASSLVEDLLDNPSALSSLGRAFPHKGPEGEIDGFRLSRIRKGSLGRQVGLRSGDVVHSINGHKLDSVAAAIGVLPDIKGTSSITVELTRRRKERTIQVDVR